MIMHRPPCYAKRLRRWTRSNLAGGGDSCIASPRCILLHRRGERGKGEGRRRGLLHNVLAPGHLSTPITDFGKGQPRRRRSRSSRSSPPRRRHGISPSSSRSRRLRAKPAQRRCHRGHAPVETCSNLPLFFQTAAPPPPPNRIEPSRAATRRFYCRDFFAARREFSEQLSARCFTASGSSSKSDVVLSSRTW